MTLPEPTTERLNVTPAPPPDLLARLTDDGAGVTVRIERGLDPLGRERVVVILVHEDAERVAALRERLVSRLRACGYRGYVV